MLSGKKLTKNKMKISIKRNYLKKVRKKLRLNSAFSIFYRLYRNFEPQSQFLSIDKTVTVAWIISMNCTTRMPLFSLMKKNNKSSTATSLA